ncbi:MAG: MotA/TolQ/ExbB proton channel family protein [Burkholderiales bacterium]|nr:MotA/TolQ/ExbB proton channel family protein [Burkholderiales bacterium]
MNRHSAIAIALFSGVFLAGFLVQGNAALFVNATAFAIVACGTLGALFLCYPAADLGAALRVTRNLYRYPPPTSNEVIHTLIEIALHSRAKGVLALETVSGQSTLTFLKRALALLVDGLREDELAEILHAEMAHFRQRRAQIERMFRQAALFAPAFGVAGSVVGLIDMLAGITEPGVILGSIPVALVSPLYGIVAANSLFFPIAEGIHAKTEKELLIHKLIADGVAVIGREPNPRRLAIMLESFLTPSARTLENLSLNELRERLREAREGGAARAARPLSRIGEAAARART